MEIIAEGSGAGHKVDDAMGAEVVQQFATLVEVFDQQFSDHEIAVEQAVIILSGHRAEVRFNRTANAHRIRFLPARE